MAKVAKAIVKRAIPLRVEYAGGEERDYVAGSLDIWRTEQFLQQAIYVALGTYSGQLALAYFTAKRAGHTVQTAGDAKDERRLFEAWLEQVALVSALADDEEVPASPLDDGSSESGP